MFDPETLPELEREVRVAGDADRVIEQPEPALDRDRRGALGALRQSVRAKIFEERTSVVR